MEEKNKCINIVKIISRHHILTTFRYNSISNAVRRVDVTTIMFNDPYYQEINVIICNDRQDQK